MSRENVEIVRRFNTPYEGENIAPLIRQAAERLGPDPRANDVLAEWSKDPAYRHIHPQIEWDVSATGAFGTVAHGPRELAMWWVDWAQAWESYVYRTTEYRDLGGWILTLTDVKALGRGGLPVEMRTYELWQVRDGQVAVYRAFLSEDDALKSVGILEQDAHADT